jgi:putative ABC transport system permease protein
MSASHVASYCSTFVHDVRRAVRAIARNPGFSAVFVLTLALGIAAATAMFTVVNGVLLRPLPYADPDRIVSLWTRYLPESGYDFDEFQLSGPEFADYRTQTRALEEVAAFVPAGGILATSDSDGDRLRVPLTMGTANLFATLGVQPALGRAFSDGDNEPGAPCVIVLSHGLWLEAFAGDANAVGRVARIDGAPCEIRGVMPAGFMFPNPQTRLWRNMIVNPAGPFWQRLSHYLLAVGRLAPGVTLAEAEAETSSLMAGWREAYPDHYTGHFVFLRPFAEDVVGGVRAELTLLFAAVWLVVLIICANLASLLLARGEGRARELAVRLALGSGRGRLVMHLLAECFVLAAVGGALGVGAAVFLLNGFLGLYAGTLPRADVIALDWRAFSFAFVTTVAAALLFGLLPALRAASGGPLRIQSRGAANAIGRARLLRGLVVGEVALSVTLVVGAGLLLRSYDNIRGVDLGFDARGVYTISQLLPASAYRPGAPIGNFYATLLQRIAALPGVRSTGAISNLPISGGAGGMDDFVIEGRPQPAAGEPTPNAGYVLATPGYFETLGIDLRAGRLLEPSDGADAPLVAVINEETARRYWPSESPIGRRLGYAPTGAGVVEPEWITIVGVVENVRAAGALEDVPPQIFFPHAQARRPGFYEGRFMTIVVRADDPLVLARTLQAAVRESDPTLPVIGGRLFEDIVSDSMGQPRFTSQIVAFFAVVALLLGALGIHGVLSYVVAQRFGELGVRLALGAQPANLLRLVVGQGMWLAALGIALGVTASVAGARLLRSLLFGVSATDVVSFGVAIAVLAAAAFLACYGPARRAARIDPMSVLRAEGR